MSPANAPRPAPASPPPRPPGSKPPTPGAAFLSRLADDSSLYAWGASVSKVAQMASDTDEGVGELAYVVISDVALTQKILRLANSATYRNAQATQVTTVSKAIFVLGFETVRLAALAMLLVEGMGDKSQAKSVTREISLALRASLIARKAVEEGPFKDDEDAAIAALFKNFGALLLASQDHGLYQGIRGKVEAGSHTLAQACSETLGFGFDHIASSALKLWRIPEQIALAASGRAPSLSSPATNRREWRQQAVAFAIEAAKALPIESEDSPALDPLMARFGAALDFPRDLMASVLASAWVEASAMEECMERASIEEIRGPAPTEAAAGPALQGLLADDFAMAEVPDPTRKASGRHPSGKPLNSQELLMAGLHDATQLLSSQGAKQAEVSLSVLETLHSAMGFRFSALCSRDNGSGAFRARLAIGGDQRRQRSFCWIREGPEDLFSLAMARKADITLSDCSAPRIQALIPEWHKELIPDALSMVILPLEIDGKPVGLLYGERPCKAPEGVNSEEAALLRLLKSQVLAALLRKA